MELLDKSDQEIKEIAQPIWYNLNDLKEVTSKIRKTKGTSLSFICDVTDDVKFKMILKKIPKLDILVNNAGSNRPEHFIKVKKENMDYLVNLNLKACFNVAQICAKKSEWFLYRDDLICQNLLFLKLARYEANQLILLIIQN